MAQRSSPQHRKRRKRAARDVPATPCPSSDPQAADHPPKGESHDDQRRDEIGQGALSADLASADDAAPFAQFLKQLAFHGNVTKAAEQAKLSPPAVRARRRHDASFDEAIKEALIEAADRLLYIARERAIHGITQPYYYQGKKCGELVKPANDLLRLLVQLHFGLAMKETDESDVTLTEEACRATLLARAEQSLGTLIDNTETTDHPPDRSSGHAYYRLVTARGAAIGPYKVRATV